MPFSVWRIFLDGKYRFVQANKDLSERLSAANDIIACLEKKIAVLTEWAGRTTDTAAMLRQLRDGTCRELAKYKQEAGACRH